MWTSSKPKPWRRVTIPTDRNSHPPEPPPVIPTGPEAAPSDFGLWLQQVSPELNWRWRHLTYLQHKLQRVYDGHCKRLLVSMPPQHGKTQQGSIRFPVWYMDRRPGTRAAIATHSQRHANRISREARKIARTRFPLNRERKAMSEWENMQGGSFVALSVGTMVAGLPIDLLIMDDTIGKRQQAESELHRENVWDWYTNDIIPRLQPGAPIVLIQTRWNEDDLPGRILASEDGPNWEVINLPAEAEENDPLGRPVGAALCPERFSLEELRAKARILLTDYTSLYQGRPVPRGGLIIQREWLERNLVDSSPRDAVRVRYWDKAATLGSGAYSAGVLMAKTRDGLYWVEDVVRGQWDAGSRNAIMRATAKYDRDQFGHVKQIFEREGGSGGKESAEISIRDLAGFDVEEDHVTGDKVERFRPFASQAKGLNVRVVKARWNARYVSELCTFPRGKYADQVDATSGAFNKLAPMRSADPGIHAPPAGSGNLGNLLNEKL